MLDRAHAQVTEDSADFLNTNLEANVDWVSQHLNDFFKAKANPSAWDWPKFAPPEAITPQLEWHSSVPGRARPGTSASASSATPETEASASHCPSRRPSS